MNQLSENNVVEMLLQSIPEIKQIYEDEIEWWDGEFPGLHNIFGDVLNPYLVDLLRNDKNEEILKRVFDFLEDMATCDDEYVKNVLMATVLEYLGDDRKILMASQKYMGSFTKKLSMEVESGLGRNY